MTCLLGEVREHKKPTSIGELGANQKKEFGRKQNK